MAAKTKEERLALIDEKIAKLDAQRKKLEEQKNKILHPMTKAAVMKKIKESDMTPEEIAIKLGLEM